MDLMLRKGQRGGSKKEKVEDKEDKDDDRKAR